MGIAVPRFLASVGSISMITRGCSEAEVKTMSSEFTSEVRVMGMGGGMDDWTDG